MSHEDVESMEAFKARLLIMAVEWMNAGVGILPEMRDDVAAETYRRCGRQLQTALIPVGAATQPPDEHRAHHPDCPVNYFTDMPQRCRCMFMAMLDRPTAPASSAAGGADGGAGRG